MDDLTLERTQWDTFWLPDEARAVDRAELGYTTSPADFPYLNNVYRARLSEHDVEPAIEEVVRAHQGRASRWSVVDASTPDSLTRQLEGAGYSAVHAHRATWLSLDDWDDVSTEHDARRVEDRATLEALLDVGAAAFGTTARPDDAALDQQVEACAPGKRVQRFVVFDGDRPVSGGGLNLYPDLGFGFLWAGGTVPDARGRGAYRALLGARVQAAREAGLRAVGLYARVNTSLPIVQRLGFTTGGWMHAWDRPASAR